MTDRIKFDWTSVDKEAVAEILKQADTCLASTVALATAADQKATRLCGMFGSAGVALLAGSMALVSNQSSNSSLIYSLGTTALLLFTACFLAAMAARPRDFHVAGYEPRKLLRGASDKEWMLRYIIEDAQNCIDANRKALERAASLAVSSMYVAAGAVVAGAAVFLLTWA